MPPAHPSPQLQRIIQVRQASSGPGWLGTAALVWLLTRPDVTDSDRDWVNAQIATQSNVASVDTGNSLNRTAKTLTFVYDGLSDTVTSGELLRVAVSAHDTALHNQAISCSVISSSNQSPAEIKVTEQGVDVTWKPTTAGFAILQCDSLKEGERRLLTISSEEKGAQHDVSHGD